MDGFYLAFVAVGVGLALVSIRCQGRIPGVTMAGWVLLGLAMCFPILVAGPLLPGDRGELTTAAVCDLLRHVLLGAAVICVGVTFALRDSASAKGWARILGYPRRKTTAEKQEEEEALDALSHQE